MTSSATIRVSLPHIAKIIDHALLQPNLTDAEIDTGLEIAKRCNVATACIKPYSIAAAKKALAGTDVQICAAIGFPHGNSVTQIKVAEAVQAANDGAQEIDMVINVGKVLSGDWDYVSAEIKVINDAVVAEGASLKAIFEIDYLEDEHIIQLCRICNDIGVAFVKTSTGYGFVKQTNGDFNYQGATVSDVKLMREHCGPEIQIKAAGGVRDLNAFLYMMYLGVTRIGTSGTVGILEQAKARGIGIDEVEVTINVGSFGINGGY
ncbi:hypothetical protein QBC38DRAFT_493906 [Podospora fimiseda]|uniref:deoxyribose-phosphate aldolase n=1 Tax=Podospora fimiseda TaxID=252190 RepID=A0AAN6YKX0_9PEZI|nr:hypothetical protein QBC38DRAFT_493906 [Podospora fimiseda]